LDVRAGCTGRQPRRDLQRGAAAVEFAVVFPLLAVIMFGLIDGGRLVASRVMLTYAVSQGARVAALSPTSQSAVESTIRGAATMLTTIAIDPVDCTSPCALGWANKAAGDRVSVTARYTFSAAFLTSFSKTLTQTSWVVVE
jgi:Flp pilus assembly protein TadG